MIVKLKEQIEQPEVVHKYYELFDTKTMKDIDGNDVEVMISNGSVSKNEIENRIKNIDEQIASLQEQRQKNEEILSEIETLEISK